MKEKNYNYELRKLEFEKSLEIRNFEISNFWKRSWFFGALIIAIASGYYVLKSTCKTAMPVSTIPVSTMPPIILSFIGFLVSLAQCLMNRGSKYWQERWEYKTKNRESALGIDVTKTERYHEKEKYYIEQCILDKKENPLCRSSRWSVSKLAILVWDIITISCFLIWLNDIIGYMPNFILHYKILFFHLIIILYVAHFYFYKQSIHQKLVKNKHNEDSGEVRNYIHDNIEES
jgi:hypothetical protein